MIKCNNLYDNQNMKQIAAAGSVKVFEYQRDLSVTPQSAITAYYSAEMNLRQRQVDERHPVDSAGRRHAVDGRRC